MDSEERWETGDATFEVCDADGAVQAETRGPRDQALRDAKHYALMYGQDGPVQIFEVLRVPVIYGSVDIAEILSAEVERLRSALKTIATANGFDNIGAWARNYAREELKRTYSLPDDVADCGLGT